MWGQENGIVGQNGASQRFAQNRAGAITLKYNGIFLDPRHSEKGLIRQGGGEKRTRLGRSLAPMSDKPLIAQNGAQ